MTIVPRGWELHRQPLIDQTLIFDVVAVVAMPDPGHGDSEDVLSSVLIAVPMGFAVVTAKQPVHGNDRTLASVAEIPATSRQGLGRKIRESNTMRFRVVSSLSTRMNLWWGWQGSGAG
jgi:hypothetical protein